MADGSSIARPYADAVFELAREANQLSNWSRLLHAAARVVDDSDVLRLIDTPNTDIGALVELVIDVSREASADDIGDPGQFSNLIRLLAENGRLTVLPEVAELYDRLKADIENTVNVLLTAATAVDDETQARISAALKRRFGREINLHFQLDENLIGGARLQADDLVIDGSVRTGLQKLASALIN